MKLKNLLSFTFLLFSVVSFQAQCPKGNAQLGFTYDAAGLTVGNRTEIVQTTWAGEYVPITNITLGSTYTLDACNNASYANFVTIFHGGSTTAVASNDNACGDDGSVQYVVPSGITSLDFQINQDPCGTNATNTTLWITLDVAALPVELVRFFATLIDGLVELKWETASESNNEGFQLEHSTDGEKWNNIAFIPGRGTSNESQEYNHTDQSPVSGVNYYRLKQIDFDGQFEYSSIVSVQVELNNNSINFFPNPASDGMVTLALETTLSGKASLKLFNLSGKQVKTQVYEIQDNYSQIDIDLTELPTGVYIAELQIGTKVWQEKLVVE